MDKLLEEKLKFYAEEIEEATRIDKEIYEKYSIKRGLRNKNGTGVLVGVTKVGDVCGYEIKDGEKLLAEGELYYRGYPLTSLVHDIESTERLGFEEVIYLLLFDRLATKNKLERFKKILAENRKLPPYFIEDTIMKVPGADIMNKMMRSMLALYTYDENPDGTDSLNVLSQALSLIAKMPLIAIYSYQVKIHNFDKKSLIIHNPDPEKSIAENILAMLRIDQKYTSEEAAILDLLLIIHAEHGGGNNSAFATHVVSSSGTDSYSAMAAGLASLKGPRHGGANIKVAKMIDNIKANVKDKEDKQEIKEYLEKILDKKAFDGEGLIYGLGHAVYTLSDPRAVLLKEKARELAKIKGKEADFAFVENIEKIGQKLIQEKFNRAYPPCANVDLYSGLVYDMLGIPRELFLPIFAIARTVGWSAHRLEQIADKKIIRPAYKSLSEMKDYISLDERGGEV
ncbi:citrate (Si)-synthase [Anaerococcus lactolyticus ATCC 51172]|uniref:citrate synthase (unknown stereospecificity) n=1 Tax=Anaerococcus lactolyticus ATCC 51172 TaxID=525254 RepID=C2BGG6_9FIRM|nr:citrate/2-methylcitrate synthase [Anaerococcus lactolyticus]EEI86093.1 citrate (Si)-synthase [Anaerococcus lactolyticus ATCC 51172]